MTVHSAKRITRLKEEWQRHQQSQETCLQDVFAMAIHELPDKTFEPYFPLIIRTLFKDHYQLLEDGHLKVWLDSLEGWYTTFEMEHDWLFAETATTGEPSENGTLPLAHLLVALRQHQRGITAPLKGGI